MNIHTGNRFVKIWSDVNETASAAKNGTGNGGQCRKFECRAIRANDDDLLPFCGFVE